MGNQNNIAESETVDLRQIQVKKLYKGFYFELFISD